MHYTSTKKRTFIATTPPGVPPEAHRVMSRVHDRLLELERSFIPSVSSRNFIDQWNTVLADITKFHECVISQAEYSVTCSRGCINCCNHWVEDVNSFEAEIIAGVIRHRYPHRIDSIRSHCMEDGEELERLDSLVLERFEENPSTDCSIDSVDLLLNVFYQMKRPCPLLDKDGGCMVYDVRPLTCRLYFSFSDPLRCDPEYINTSGTSTCIIDLSEEVNSLLDMLHFRYMRFDGDTGLRSQLAKYLAE